MCRDAEQWFCELTDRGYQKILDILTCQNNRGFLLAHTLHAVANIFNCRHVCQEQIHLINARGGVSFPEKLIAHKGEDIEQHRIFEPFVSIQQSFYAEHKEFVVRDITVTIKVFALRTHAHGVDAKAHLLERFLSVKVFPLLIIAVEFFLAQLIEILHNWIIGCLQLAVVGAVGNSKSSVELRKQDFNGVDLTVTEILICSEKVFEIGNVLRQPSCPSKSNRCTGININLIPI